MSTKDHDPAELPAHPMGGSRTINSVVRDEMVRLPLEALGLGPALSEPPVADITWGFVGLSGPTEGHTWRYARWLPEDDGTTPVEEHLSRGLRDAFEELYKEAGQPSAVAQARGVRSEPVDVGVQEQWGEEFER